jgi:biopolymer transport protein ExbD
MTTRSIMKSIARGCLRVATAAVVAAASLDGSPAAHAQLGEDSVVVAIPNEAEFYVGTTRVPRDRVVADVDARLNTLGPEQHVVFIKADRRIRYGTIVRLVDDLRVSGHDRVGLVVDTRDAQPEAAQNDPSSAAASPAPAGGDDADAVVLSIRRGRAATVIRVDGVRTPAERVASATRDRLRERGLRTVMILAPTEMAYADVVDLIDAAKSSGAVAVGLGVDALATEP